MTPQKAYFEMPNFDYPPGTIQLGQIIDNPKLPGSIIGQPYMPLPQSHESYKTNWEKEKSRSLNGSTGIWAQFIATVLDIRGNANGSLVWEDSSVLKFKRLETLFFSPDPSPEYVKSSMLQPTVKQYFENNLRKTPYMITGIKVARGPEGIKRKVRKASGNAQLKINGRASGEPASGGPHIGWKRSLMNEETFTASSDFVFAYRLRKIKIIWKTMDIESKDFVRGAVYHEGLGAAEDGETEDTSEIVSANLEDRDLGIIPDTKNIPLDWIITTVKDEEDEEDCVTVTFAA